MPNRGASGFTLLELLLVLVLVGIGVSLGLVSVDRMAGRSQERQWVDQTYQSLRKLRNKAIISSTSIEADLSFEKGQILLLASRAPATSIIKLPEKYYFSATPVLRTPISQLDSTTLVFYPDGTMRDETFYLHTPSGYMQGFRLTTVSGRIEKFDALPKFQ